jgi:hypothetical protein
MKALYSGVEGYQILEWRFQRLESASDLNTMHTASRCAEQC